MELARSHIRMQMGDKTVTIQCEGYLPGHGAPDFDVHAKSIHHWDPPNAGTEIDEATRDRILRLLREEVAQALLTIQVR